MYKISKLNEIASVIDEFLPAERFDVQKEAAAPDAILVRSANMHEMPLGENLLAVARAGAGVNNIPLDACAEKGVVVFNTPGANANGVKELILGTLITLSRNVVDAADWAKTLKGSGDAVGKMVEKGKNSFVGPEIKNKTLGVIGLGAIGTMVANDAHALGMKVLGYDPYISVENAWRLSRGVRHCVELDQLFGECDYITIHVPLIDSTKGLICAESIAKMKDGVRILNFARGGLVKDDDLIAAVQSGKVAGYATDFPSDALIGHKNILCIPHLGASTPEAEDNCARMAAKQLCDFLEYGNIKNSVNYPDCELPHTGHYRLTLLHRNIANMVGQITSLLAKENININNMINKSRNAYAYTLLDLDDAPTAEAIERLNQIEGIIRVRAIDKK